MRTTSQVSGDLDDFFFRLPGRPPTKKIQPPRRSRNENLVDFFRGPECGFRAGVGPFFFRRKNSLQFSFSAFGLAVQGL